MTTKIITVRENRRKRDYAGDAGTSLVEFALLLPILLILLLGIIEIGRYAEMSILVTNAARAGVQYGAQNLANAADLQGIQTAASNDAPAAVQQSQVSTSYMCLCTGTGGNPGGTCPAACVPPGQEIVYLTVTTAGTYTSLFRYPGIPSPVTLTGTAQMRVAQ
jgi:Flp pilus assembly protein TadG